MSTAAKKQNSFRLGVYIAGAIGLAFALVPPLKDQRWHLGVVFAAVLAIAAIQVRRAFQRKDTLSPFFVAGAVYQLSVAAGLAVFADSEHPSKIVMAIITAISVASAVSAVVFASRAFKELTELERLIFANASAFAFAVTIAAVLTGGIVETWFRVHGPNDMLFVGIGLVVWIFAAKHQAKKYA